MSAVLALKKILFFKKIMSKVSLSLSLTLAPLLLFPTSLNGAELINAKVIDAERTI